MIRSLPILILLLLILTSLLAGCSGEDIAAQAQAMPVVIPGQTSTVLPQAAPTTAPTATTVPVLLLPTSTALPTRTPIPTLPESAGMSHQAVGPARFPAGVNPLTGLEVSDSAALMRRPVVVKVTNFPRAVRPQWGLRRADHVYEYYLEDLITRFIGVFYGESAERVGPVRSARFFDEHIVRMYKAFFVFGWADDRVVDPWTESDLKKFLVVERGDNCPPMCRIGPSYNYNTLFVDLPALQEYLSEKGINNDPQDLTGLQFDRLPPFSPKDVWQIFVRYSAISYNRWDYNPNSRSYFRYQETDDSWQGEGAYQPLSDSLTGEQIQADNVVVLLLPHGYFMNTKTTEMVTMDFLGKGSAYIFRDGKIYPAQWERKLREDLVSLVYPDGSPFPLKPGKTWFIVLGESSKVSQAADGSWHFEFAIP